MLSRQVADKLQQKETPFYFYDLGLLERTLETLTGEAAKYGYTIHYAIKANCDPRVIETIRRYGVGIDCASGNEVRCAIEAGFDPQKVVYAGVGKRDKEIRYAVEQGIFCINCESLEEMHVIDRIAAEAGRKVTVGVRVNPDIDPKTNHCIDTGQADCKFGISYEEVQAKASEILSLEHLDVKGIHLHIGSQIRNFGVYNELCDKVNAIVENLVSLGFKFEFVDVGGGLGINYDCPEAEPIPDFARVFELVNSNLKVGGRPVHFEFGRSIVGECGELITRVLYNKTTATGRKLLIIDASMTELIRPMLYGAYHNIENITSASEQNDKYTVVGTACESTDVFDENITLPITRRGDILTVKSAGAYGMSMASRYNQHDLPGAVYSDEL
ncbi:MAG: diaminopimelate decarboxylase [Bacteroidales bacterium]|nr:diaminopimelate decarboxylase [Candidatus Cryptobacteroides onthequi]